MIYKEGHQLCAGGDTAEHHEEIRKYMERHGLTPDDAKRVRRTCKETGRVDLLLIAKRDVELRGK